MTKPSYEEIFAYCEARHPKVGRPYREHSVRKDNVSTYKSWASMIARCYCESYGPTFERYGGAGVTVCDRWRHSFENFLSDMGPRPLNSSLDRFPNGTGNYQPGNCRWATREEQAHNRKTTRLISSKNGETKSVKQWAEFLEIPTATLHYRIRHWPLEIALSVGRIESQSKDDQGRFVSPLEFGA